MKLKIHWEFPAFVDKLSTKVGRHLLTSNLLSLRHLNHSTRSSDATHVKETTTASRDSGQSGFLPVQQIHMSTCGIFCINAQGLRVRVRLGLYRMEET